jgi:hypothetical protein
VRLIAAAGVASRVTRGGGSSEFPFARLLLRGFGKFTDVLAGSSRMVAELCSGRRSGWVARMV